MNFQKRGLKKYQAAHKVASTGQAHTDKDQLRPQPMCASVIKKIFLIKIVKKKFFKLF